MITIVTDLGVVVARQLAMIDNDGSPVRIHFISKPGPDGMTHYTFKRNG